MLGGFLDRLGSKGQQAKYLSSEKQRLPNFLDCLWHWNFRFHGFPLAPTSD